MYPDLSSREMVVPEDLINKGIGVQLETAQMADLLSRMQLQAEAVPGSQVRVLVPPTRSDVLHACDVMEVSLDQYAVTVCCPGLFCHRSGMVKTAIAGNNNQYASWMQTMQQAKMVYKHHKLFLSMLNWFVVSTVQIK